MAITRTFIASLLAGICIASPMGQPSIRETLAPRSFDIKSAYQRLHSHAGIQIVPSIIDGPIPANNGPLSFSNWAGALLESSNITSVTGTFTVPNPEVPSGGNSSTAYCGCAWIGIDGYSVDCPNGGLIQAGATWCIQDGSPSVNAWYEWYPAQAITTFDNFDVQAGDEIKVTVTATSSSTGYTVVENLTQGTQIRHTWDTESPALCEATAEWIVEDFTDTSNGSDYLAPFADYNGVVFTDNSATAKGEKVDVSNARPVNMVQNGNTVSEATILVDQILVTYTG
ncbi:aspergillopepsin-2 precursor, putative [Paecilomyces variotii No. 5]|uniref:Aspergillopepsin-2, putative n=1 Tax=Byssochlamys spectabilis (strain No. 5 / NBRC 109023) TaxID=1356009 RepID=V5FFV9_BYSSN|nr:aspergillopepsin-2 precursor, putative [Paecilomyces variotii No. 5]